MGDWAWLNAEVAFATDRARVGPIVAGANARYGSASCHFALSIHQLLDDKEKNASLVQLVEQTTGTPADAASAMKKLVRNVPLLLETDNFSAPTGLYDFVQILATAHFARGRTEFSAKEGTPYRVFLSRLQWLLWSLKTLWLRTNITPTVKAVDFLLDNVIGNAGDEDPLTIAAAAPRIFERFVLLGKDLMPTPLALVAPVGISADMPADDSLHRFIEGIHTALLSEPGRTPLLTVGQYSVGAEFIIHMQHFLIDAADRLITAVLPCDRAPIVAPWYAAIVLSVRTYAHTLLQVLGKKQSPPLADAQVDNVAFTLFVIVQLCDPDVATELGMELPAHAFCSCRSRDMYTGDSAQYGPWWVLLRAALSGISIAEAIEVAKRLVALSATQPQKARLAAFLCVCVHTQAGMAVVGYNTDGGTSISSFPVMNMMSRTQTRACRHSPIDVLLTTFSGTIDLASLASDDLAFTDISRQEEAWRVELTGEKSKSSKSVLHPEIVIGFCNAIKALAFDFLDVYIPGATNAELDMGAELVPLSVAEAETVLLRVGTSDATSHCCEWLQMAHAVNTKYEQFMQSRRKEPPLIKSPLLIEGTANRADHVLQDEAFLRANFCALAEQALHGSRHAGLWTGGRHLVLMAWLSCATPQSEDGEPFGLRVFARVITEHTIRSDDAIGQKARLLPEGWASVISERGLDSIVEAARRFERLLHFRNMDAMTDFDAFSKSVPEKYKELDAELPSVASADSSAPPTLPPAMPCIPGHSIACDRLAAKAKGPLRFDRNVILSLDGSTTDSALEGLRLACNDKHRQASTYFCASPFLHGACVEVASFAPSIADVKYRREQMGEGSLLPPPPERAGVHGKLLERIAEFSQATET